MKRGHSFDTVMTLVLFSLFTGAMLLVLMLGVESYQGISASVEQSYQERTCLQYIATKVSHYSGTGAVSVTEFGDGTALVLQESFDGDLYNTYLYEYNGMAMELFCASDVDLGPEAGFEIMAVENLQVEAVTQSLLQISCTGSNGGIATQFVQVHGGEGGGL